MRCLKIGKLLSQCFKAFGFLFKSANPVYVLGSSNSRKCYMQKGKKKTSILGQMKLENAVYHISLRDLGDPQR